MKISEVRVFPVESKDGKLKAFATMTFDDWFVVRNVKVIQGNSGLFVAMPSRKAMDSCPKCRFKNVRGSRYCNQCGSGIGRQPAPVDEKTPAEHMDIAHPIKQECRMYIQEQVLSAYERETKKQKREGGSYKLRTIEDLDVFSGEDLRKNAREDVAQTSQVEVSGGEGSKDIEL
ncbi:MAG: septation protein SpoVG family protein [Candidatus Omnitrophota bacterium]